MSTGEPEKSMIISQVRVERVLRKKDLRPWKKIRVKIGRKERDRANKESNK